MSNIDLVFSLEAQEDIDDIQQYTFEEFGLEQMLDYEQILFAGFERIRLHPQIGRVTDDDNRELVVGKHIVLYGHTNNAITILRVMHPRRLRGR